MSHLQPQTTTTDTIALDIKRKSADNNIQSDKENVGEIIQASTLFPVYTNHIDYVNTSI